jgi:hypothetical protein
VTHEYFSSDADAIEEFLLMGRRNLAVMAATECPEAMDDLMPLLRKMAASEDAQVARAISEYLAEGRPHARLKWVEDEWFGPATPTPARMLKNTPGITAPGGR